MSDEAKAELAKAIDFKPTDPSVLVAIARVHLVTNDAKSAGAILATLKEGPGVTPAELNTLKGWQALEQNQWEQAKQFLTQATTLNPNPSEAFFLLGRVYDHDKDAAKACDCYRQAFETSDEGKQMNAVGIGKQ
jgi:Flp pilus assembly protein TadD